MDQYDEGAGAHSMEEVDDDDEARDDNLIELLYGCCGEIIGVVAAVPVIARVATPLSVCG